jgi:EpsI family protein
MIRRRDLLIGGACVTASAGAYGLTPRRRVSLLGSEKLDDIVPRTFGEWTSVDMNDEVAPREEGSLASKLYGQTLGRLYTNAKTGAEVMMLLAWGDTQSNQLQVHRPEVCYPAFGYHIDLSAPLSLALGGSLALPARRLVVSNARHREGIVYWTRLGRHLPRTVAEQRIDRFRTALAGEIPDGLLARFGWEMGDHAPDAGPVERFILELITAVRPLRRPALVGPAIAAGLPQ